MLKMSKRNKICAILLLIIILVFLILGFNTNLKTTYYTYSSSKIPIEFDGYTIVQISDYHNEDFGDYQIPLITAVAQANPDIIVLTGDIIDKDQSDITPSQQMIEGVAALAPTYFITGNHELDPNAVVAYDQLQTIMQQNGVTHLDDKAITLENNGESIMLTGQKYLSHYVTNFLPAVNEDYFNILLYHGSDDFDLIAPYGYDLVLSGHAHGGIVKLPFVGGVFGNDGNLFPKYDSGVFQNGDSTLIASSGIGDAKVPRFFNPPEIVVITLEHVAE